MKSKIIRLLAVASAAFFYVGTVSAQNAGTVTNHAFAIGKGVGSQGYTSLLCTSAQLVVGQSAADPICQTITGDVTINSGGVTAIGATKVTSAMLNADVFSTAHSWVGQQTFVAPILGTPASGVATNLTGLPISTGVSGLGAGCATFLGTPSSANLRGCLTDEVGTGAAYFIGGALGTPASGTATNITGLPLSGLTTQGAYTIVANNSGSSASPTAVDITALTSKASPVSGDVVLIQDSAASNAFKKTTVGALASAGSVSSIAGNTGAFTLTGGITNSANAIKLALNNATLQAGVSAPTGTISTSNVMMGMGSTCILTPVYSTRVQISIIGAASSSVAGQFAALTVKFGTGAAPSNGAAVTGTTVGQALAATSITAGAGVPYNIGGIATGLTAGTTYWFDMAVSSSSASSTAAPGSPSCTLIEF